MSAFAQVKEGQEHLRAHNAARAQQFVVDRVEAALADCARRLELLDRSGARRQREDAHAGCDRAARDEDNRITQLAARRDRLADPAEHIGAQLPSSSATIAEPSFTITRVIGSFLTQMGKACGRDSQALGVEAEHDAGDLDIITGLEAVLLERADHADLAQARLDVGERLVVVEVVARNEAVDAGADDAEWTIAVTLDAKAPMLGRAEGHVLGKLRLG